MADKSLMDLLNGPLSPTISSAMNSTKSTSSTKSDIPLESSVDLSKMELDNECEVEDMRSIHFKNIQDQERIEKANVMKYKKTLAAARRYSNMDESSQLNPDQVNLINMTKHIEHWRKVGHISLINMTRTHDGRAYNYNMNFAKNPYSRTNYSNNADIVTRLKFGLVDELGYAVTKNSLEQYSPEVGISLLGLSNSEENIRRRVKHINAVQQEASSKGKAVENDLELFILKDIIFTTSNSIRISRNKQHGSMISTNVPCSGVLYDCLTELMLSRDNYMYYKNGSICSYSEIARNYANEGTDTEIVTTGLFSHEEVCRIDISKYRPILVTLGLTISDIVIKDLNILSPDKNIPYLLGKDIIPLGRIIKYEDKLHLLPLSLTESRVYELSSLNMFNGLPCSSEDTFYTTYSEDDLNELNPTDEYAKCVADTIKNIREVLENKVYDFDNKNSEICFKNTVEYSANKATISSTGKTGSYVCPNMIKTDKVFEL